MIAHDIMKEKEALKSTLELNPNINPYTVKAIVEWVENLLESRLYHVWTIDYIKKQLSKSIIQGGAGLNEEEISNLNDFDCNLVMKLINESNMLSEKQFNSKLVKWIQKISTNFNDQLHINRFFKNTKFDSPIFNELAYQPNSQTIKLMAETLLDNMLKGEVRFQTLLINSAYFGSGKTRLGVEFLSQFKSKLESDINWKNELVNKYSQDNIEQLLYSKPVYINCCTLNIKNTMEETFQALSIQISEYLGSDIELTRCFIIIDELGALIQSYQPTILIKNVHPHICAMYEILHKLILPFQQIRTVSLYLCGKGAFLDLIDSGRLKPLLRSPTNIKSIHLEALSNDDIQAILFKSEKTKSLVTYLPSIELLDYFTDKIYEETRGVPYFVVHYLIHYGYLNLWLFKL